MAGRIVGAPETKNGTRLQRVARCLSGGEARLAAHRRDTRRRNPDHRERPLFIWFVRESSARACAGNSSAESRPDATRAAAVPPVMIRSSTPIMLNATGVVSDVAENSPAAATW